MTDRPASRPVDRAGGDEARTVSSDVPGSPEAPRREPGVETPVTGEVRIAAPVASVAATGRVRPGDPEFTGFTTGEPTGSYELPDWADPPTGQVPRVLLAEDAPAPEMTLRGPMWRQENEGFEEEIDLSLLAADDAGTSAVIAGSVEPEEAPFEFSFAELDVVVTESEPAAPDAAEAAAWVSEERAAAAERRRRHSQARVREAKAAAPGAKNAVVATLTGLVLGALCVAAFLFGPLGALVLGAVALTVAAGEAFGALQRVGYRPATLLGLIAVPALVVGAYLHQGVAVPVVLGVFVLASAAWFLRRASGDEPIGNLAVTVLVVAWIGVLGSFAGLLLSPGFSANRQGLAVVLGALILTVAHDVGSYAVGSKLGRHLLAPAISPGKTVEGLIGGTVLTLVVGAAALPRLHPFDVASGLGLAAAVAVVAPIGDLWESRVKREVGLKDMGSLLPSHGGVLDRIDALVFVLPAAYLVARAANLA